MAQAVIFLAGEIGIESVGLDEIGAGVQILAADIAYDLRLGQGQKIVVAAQIAGMIAEACPTEIVFAKLETLDHHPQEPSSSSRRFFASSLHPADTGVAVETHDNSFSV